MQIHLIPPGKPAAMGNEEKDIDRQSSGDDYKENLDE